jgi:hypothetical protein
MPGRVCLVVLGGVFLLLSRGATGQPGPELKQEGAKPEAMLRPLPLEESLIKARVNDQYRMLLRQFKVEKDAEMHKGFADVGLRDLTEYAGQTELPKGHWVYVYPYWYIWRDQTAMARPKRPYGNEQLTGPPDVLAGGDNGAAWCSQTADDQDEWLLLEYPEPIMATAVLIHANYNPGSVARVTVFKLDGTEVEVWKGEDPTPIDSQHGVSVIPFKVDFKITRVKVYLNSIDTPSWNEIDTVGLRDASGELHWPSAAEASSTYATDAPQVFVDTGLVISTGPLMERLMSLEAEVKELKELLKKKDLDNEVKELRDVVKELKELLKKKD